MWKKTKLTAVAAVLAATCTFATSAFAENWPTRPLRWIVPYAAGGPSDAIARVVGQKLGERLGQPVIIENKAGAGGILGTDFVAKSAPDGYTMILGNIGPMAVNRTLYKSLPYDPEQDLIPISLLQTYGIVVLVNPSFPAKTLPELIERGRSESISYAGNGVGTSLHLTGELLARRTGMQLQHIAYRGDPPGLSDAMAGIVPMVMVATAGAIPYIKSGKLRALAVTTRERVPQLPDLPTASEQGVPDFDVTGWLGVLVPKGTPEPIVARLVTEFTAVMQTPDVQRAVIDEMGSNVPPLGPKYFQAFIKSETAKWREVILASKIKPE